MKSDFSSEVGIISENVMFWPKMTVVSRLLKLSR